MRILIVDDNPTNTMIIREILKKENYRNTVTVTSARDMFERLGVKNLDAVEESGPSDVDLILLDMMGHGISSSLFCMFISSVLKNTVFTYVEPKLDLESKLIQYYFTAIYLVVDTRRKVIEYVNAGHPPALLYTDNKHPVRLDQMGPPVGLFDGIETHPYRCAVS